jgi:hypothetical protein
MGSPATHEDAQLILRLYDLRRDDRMRQARQWFATMYHPISTIEDFNRLCPPGSGQNASFRMVTSYWEMAASFVAAGVLNDELFFQSCGELLLTWEKIRDLVPALREVRRNKRLYRNLETVATRMAEYMTRESPESYETFAGVVRNMAR